MVVLKVLGVLSAIISAFMIWPLGWAIIDGSSDVLPFVKSVTIGLLTSLAFLFLSRKSKIQDIEAREVKSYILCKFVLVSGNGLMHFSYFLLKAIDFRA